FVKSFRLVPVGAAAGYLRCDTRRFTGTACVNQGFPMRRLFAAMFGSARSSRRRSPTASRGVRLAVEGLESRLLLHAAAMPAAGLYAAAAQAPILTHSDALGEVVIKPTGGIFLDPEPFLEQDLPKLHSKADAPVKIHLDFTGYYQSDWWEYDGGQRVDHYNVATPGFDTDGDIYH